MQRLLSSEIIKESLIYQEILLEVLAKGKNEGKAEGRSSQGVAKEK